MPVTYRTERAVAAAAAGNLLAAPGREGSAEPFSDTNPRHGLRWTRAAFCRSAPDKALSQPARRVCLRCLHTWKQSRAAVRCQRGQRRCDRPTPGEEPLRAGQGSSISPCGHGDEVGEGSHIESFSWHKSEARQGRCLRERREDL